MLGPMWLCPVLLVIFSIQEANAGAHLSIKLLSYSNPSGKDAANLCCDGGVFSRCNGACDHFFRVCVDFPSGSSDNIDSCPLGQFRTQAIQNQNEISFGPNIGSSLTSKTFDLTSWPGSALIKVGVYDEDPLSHDEVELLHTTFTKNPDLSKAKATATGVIMKQRTSLNLEASVYCDPNYYGPNCAVFCVPKDGTQGQGHYDCGEDGTKICYPGWTGSDCESSIDECGSSPCSDEGGTCMDHINGFSCVCHSGFTGKLCDDNVKECASNPCKNGANCTDLVNDINCTCAQGYDGRFCEYVVEGCSADPCGPGTCIEEGGKYMCNCPKNTTGLHCETDLYACESNPCTNHGTCIPKGTEEYDCICEDGWVGKDCNDSYNDCENVTCPNNMTCMDMEGAYQCVCPTEDGCVSTTDPCESKPCQNEGQCIPGSDSYLCRCPDYFKGRHCEMMSANCTTNPCQNGGTCQDMTEGSTCTCPKEYTGATCRIEAKDKDLQITDSGPVLVSPCSSSPCENNATCLDRGSQFRCVCQLGFTGETCSLSLQKCSTDVCNGNGECISTGDKKSCSCHHGYTGQWCESEVPNPCNSNPCLHEGSCESRKGYYFCHCTSGFTGLHCESDIDECHYEQCHNGGTCENTFGSYYCACSEDFTGSHCESDITYNDTDAVMKNHKIHSGIIYMKGLLGRLDLDKIHVLVREVLNDHLDTTHVKIYNQIHTCDSLEDGSPVSLYVFKLAIHGKPVHEHILLYTVEKLATEDYKLRFPRPVTTRSECEEPPESGASTHKTSAWKDRYWIYLIVMAVLCVVAIIVIALIIRDRRRHKWQPYSSTVVFSRLDEGAPSGEEAVLKSARKTSASQDYDVLVTLNQENQRKSTGEPRNFRLSSNYN